MINCVILAGGKQRRMNGEFDKIEFCRKYIPSFVKYEYATNSGKENAGTLHNWLKENLLRKETAENPLLIVNGDVIASAGIWRSMTALRNSNVWLLTSKEMRGGFMWQVQPMYLDRLLSQTGALQDKWVEYSFAELPDWNILLTDDFVTDIDCADDARNLPVDISGR